MKHREKEKKTKTQAITVEKEQNEVCKKCSLIAYKFARKKICIWCDADHSINSIN